MSKQLILCREHSGFYGPGSEDGFTVIGTAPEPIRNPAAEPANCIYCKHNKLERQLLKLTEIVEGMTEIQTELVSRTRNNRGL